MRARQSVDISTEGHIYLLRQSVDISTEGHIYLHVTRVDHMSSILSHH